MRKPRLPHLLAARRTLVAPPGYGLCFHLSAALTLDLPGCTYVVADLEGEPGTRMHHAWVEHRGEVFAPTTIDLNGGLFGLNPSAYYQTNDARDFGRVPYRDLVPVLRRINYPAHLMRGLPLRRDRMQGQSFGGLMLQIAGFG